MALDMAEQLWNLFNVGLEQFKDLSLAQVFSDSSHKPLHGKDACHSATVVLQNPCRADRLIKYRIKGLDFRGNSLTQAISGK